MFPLFSRVPLVAFPTRHRQACALIVRLVQSLLQLPLFNVYRVPADSFQISLRFKACHAFVDPFLIKCVFRSGSSPFASGAVECAVCLPGRFAANPGSTFCAECAAGSSGQSSGQIGCVKCAGGRFANVSGLTSCLDCPVATRGATGQSAGSAYCVACEPGKVYPAPAALLMACFSMDPVLPVRFVSHAMAVRGMHACSTTLIVFETGSYSVAGQSVCAACAAGSFNPSLGQSSCSLCLVGTETPLPGALACVQCQVSFTACKAMCFNWFFAAGHVFCHQWL
jgi:hypothetical protein